MTKTELWKVPVGGRFIDADGLSACVLSQCAAMTEDGDEIRVAHVQMENGAMFALRGDMLVLAGKVH